MPQQKYSIEFRKLFVRSMFFFIIGVVLASLFLWTIVQGVMLQLSGESQVAIICYFLAFMAGIAALYNYMQAKTTFHYAKLS